MSITFRATIDGAKFRADLSTNGVGPHLGERVTDPEWRELCNDAVRYAWKIASSARPDFQVAFADTTLISGVSALIPVASNFYDLIDVVSNPDTPSEASLGPYAWQNRRAPGGWMPPFFTGSGASRASLMGTNIYIEPSVQAAGNYRVWYCPTPKLIRTDVTVRLATAGALPTYSSGGSGPTHVLTGALNGLLSVDGLAVATNDVVLVKDALSTQDNGIYTVDVPGSGGAPFQLRRLTPYTTTTGLTTGIMFYVSAGATNVDLFFELTATLTTIEVSPVLFAEAFVDPILADHAAELLKIKTAIPAIDRDDDLSLTQLNRDLLAEEGQLATYLKMVRTANGPRKLIDTDAIGPRAWWGSW